MATDPPNGSGPHRTPPTPKSIGEVVAEELRRLVEKMEEHRKAIMRQELKMTGYAGVLVAGVLGTDGDRHPVVFGEESAAEVAGVVKEVGDHVHTLGSEMYQSSDAIRAAGKKGG